MLKFNLGFTFYNGDIRGNNPGLEGEAGETVDVPPFVIEGICSLDLNKLLDYYRKHAESIDTVHIIKSYGLVLARINNSFDIVVKNDYPGKAAKRIYPIGASMSIDWRM